MGRCWNCGKQITLKDEEIKCDNCGKIINYQCWNCKNWFSIYDEEKKERLKECKYCGFFVCPFCKSCGKKCIKGDWIKEIRRILNSERDQEDKIKDIADYFEEVKLGKEQKKCPRGVPISYAKARIKSCIIKLKGYRIKNQEDLTKFKERLNEIMSKKIGSELTIEQSREAGSYGQEYRDIFNYCLCIGKLQKIKRTKIIDNEKIEYIIYKRVELGDCPKLDLKKLIFKICTNPKCPIKEFPLSQTECCYCKYKKGDKKGKFYPLKLKISNKDICQLERGEFKKEEDGEI